VPVVVGVVGDSVGKTLEVTDKNSSWYVIIDMISGSKRDEEKMLACN
jgi:hypothetical protein